MISCDCELSDDIEHIWVHSDDGGNNNGSAGNVGNVGNVGNGDVDI